MVGAPALSHETLFATLYAITRQAPGGINAQAIAAIENALLDIKGKALGVPCYELFGGKIRDSLPLYWSHCGSYRMNRTTAEMIGRPVLSSLKDLAELGAEVRGSGYTALKCNMYRFNNAYPVHSPGFARRPNTPGAPELNADTALLSDLQKQMTALREGTGDSIDILLDMNFNFKTEGYLRVIRALKQFNLLWFELDLFNPGRLSHLFGNKETRRLPPVSRYTDTGSSDLILKHNQWTLLSSIFLGMALGSRTKSQLSPMRTRSTRSSA